LSHFEYISVAVALVLSLAISRLLGGISAATQRDRVYPIHLFWIAQTLLSIIAFW